MVDVASLRATLALDDTRFKAGLAESVAAMKGATTETQKIAAGLAAHLKVEAQATAEAQRSAIVKRQEIALNRELTAARTRLTELLAGESKLVADVGARYSGLSNARRAELIEVKQQTAAYEALAVAKKNVARNLQTIGGALTGAVTTPALVIGGAAVASALDVQGGANQIAAGTGAQGAQLQALEAVYRRVAVTVPQSFKEVGTAVGTLFARTHETGQALSDLATNELNLSRITGGDLQSTITKTTQVFAAWHIAVADQIPTLDKMEKAHQATGVNVIALANTLSRSAATFQGWGLTINDSIGLLANFQKANIAPERAVTGLTAGMAKLAKAGVTDLHAAFRQIIKDLSDTDHPSKVFAEATNLFGTRTGPQFAKAIQDGSLSLSDFSKMLDQSGGAIAKTAEATQTFGTRFKTELKAAEIALEPLGVELLKIGTEILKGLQPVIDKVGELAGWFGKLSPAAKDTTVVVVALAAAFGPGLVAVGKWITALQEIKTAWLALTLVLKGSQGYAAVTAGLQSISLAATLAVAPWVLAFGAMAFAVYTLVTRLDDAKRGMAELASDAGAGWKTLGNLGSNLAHGHFRGALTDAMVRAGGDQTAQDYAEYQRQQAALPIFQRAGNQGARYGPGEFAAVQARDQQFLRGSSGGGSRGAPGLNADDAQRLAAVEAGKKARVAAAQQISDALDKEREAALRAQAALHFGELSPQVAAVDLFAKSFGALSGAHQKAAIQLAGYRKEEEAAKSAMQAAEQAAQARRQAQERLTQAVADSRIEYLKADAKSRFGDLSREGLALEILNTQWKNLSHAQQQAVLTALDWKRRTKAIDDERQATEGLAKTVDDLNLKYLALTAKTPLGRFAASNLGVDASTLNHDQKALANRAMTVTGNIDTQTRINDAQASAQGAYVDYLKAQAKADFGEQSKSYIALDQFKHSWGTLTDAEKAATVEILKYQLATAALTPATAKLTEEQKQLIGAWEKAGSLAEEQFKRHLELTGTSKGLTAVQVALNEALANGDDELALWLASIGDATKANDKLAKDMAQQQKLIQQAASGTAGVVANSLQNIWQHGFKGFFANVIDGFKQMFQQIALDIIRSEIQRKITDALTPKPPSGSGGGGGGGGAAGLLTTAIQIYSASQGGGISAVDSGAYRSGYASGGDVMAGVPITVGERGSETFVPRTAGTILPHGAQTQGATHISQTFIIQTPNPQAFRQSQGQILADANRSAMLAARRGS